MGHQVQNRLFADGRQFYPVYYRSSYTFQEAPDRIELKEQLMYEILLAKFSQNPTLLKALIETNDAQLIENNSSAKYDGKFWGTGNQRKGRNALGIALMRVREDLLKELRISGSVTHRYGFSPELCRQLGIKPSIALPQTTIVTKQDLDSRTATTTVADYRAAQSLPSQVIPTTAKARVIEAIQQKYHFKATLEVADDRDPFKKSKVIKLRFEDATNAKEFANTIGKGFVTISGNTVILGPRTQVFENLKVPTHGKRQHFPMCEALVFESAQTLVHHKSPLDKLKQAVQDSDLTISMNDRDQIQLHFSDSNAANKFQEKCGKVWRNQDDPCHFSIGKNQEGFVFEKLKIPEKHDFGNAIREYIQQNNTDSPRPY